MDTLEAIRTRRSVRTYEERPVGEPVIRELLGAAMQAPSAGNARPWQFIVITDRRILSRVPGINPHAAMAPGAAFGVVVCGDLSLEEYPGRWVADCSTATENLLLAAHAKGLGAVWTGIHPVGERMSAFRELLGLPEHVMPLAFVPVGYPKETPAPEDRFEEKKVHRNGW